MPPLSELTAPPRFRPSGEPPRPVRPPPPERRPPSPPPPPRPPRQRAEGGKGGKGGKGGWGRRILTVLAVLAIWVGMAGAGLIAYFAYDLPDISQVAQADRRPAVTLLAADGTPFHRFGDLRGETLDVSQLPRHLIDALVATEDRRYWSHFGVDPLGIARAFYANHRAGRTVQGGSTLTQQLAKNLFLTPDQTLRRKAQEALLAIRLEHEYSKEQILTAYLNRVYLGAGTFGIDAAARTYFNKSARDLNLRESAIIVGLLKAPSRYAPTANPDRATRRMGVVLRAMEEEGYITEAQLQAAMAPPPDEKRDEVPDGDGRYLAGWVADQVAGFVGADHGDLVVRTTFDGNLQRIADAQVAAMLAGPGAEANVGQAAAVIMAPDGAVHAMVGGRGYDKSEFNRATQALRQPGSSFKPIVYLAALEAGWSENSTILDAPYTKGKWHPGNYDGKFRGEVTLSTALANSLNTATIRLMEAVGVDNVRNAAKRLGLTTTMRRDLSLALGTSETTLLELTGAYATLANEGQGVIPYAITEIRDTSGNVLYRRQGSSAGYAVAAPYVEAMNRLLSGPVERGTGKAAKLDRPTVGKTGTTQDYKDAWFVGYTADLVGGVWLGNDDGKPMKKVTGGGLPAKLWHSIMVEAHQGLPARGLPGLNRVPTDDPIGALLAQHPGDGMETTADAGIAEVHSEPLGEPPPPEPEPTSGDPIGNLLRRLTGKQ